MRWLLTMVRAIGRVVGITHPVGHVVPVQDFQTGGDSNTVAAQPQRAKRESRAKRSVAQAGTTALSSKTETSSAPTPTKKSSTRGTQSATLVLQPAKSKPNSKRSVAQQGITEPLHSKGTLPVQVVHGEPGQPLVIPVKQSRQGRKPKPLAVQSTTAVKLSSKEPTTTKRKATVLGKPAVTPASKTRQHAK